MNKIIFILFMLFACNANAQTHTLEKIWETDSIFAIPESVLPDLKNEILYVSLIDGGGWEADGQGGVGKLSMDGQIYDSTFITGMDAPKGLAKFENKLYAADISNVVVIDLQEGKVTKTIPIPGATGLNDITTDDNGIIYVSDSREGKIWRIENGVPTLFLDNLEGVNGLMAVEDMLYIGARKNFIKADKNKNITTVALLPQGIDGIEPAGNGDFILSSWLGYLFYVTKDGAVETLLDSHTEKMNTADIGYDKIKRIIYVPTFFAKKIVAYQLK